MKKKLATIVLAGAMALGGAAMTLRGTQAQEPLVTVTARPISTSQGTSRYSSSLASVLEKDGKRIIAYTEQLALYHRDWEKKVVMADALLEAEIADRDDDKVTVRGIYKGFDLEMHSITVEGREIRFYQ